MRNQLPGSKCQIVAICLVDWNLLKNEIVVVLDCFKLNA